MTITHTPLLVDIGKYVFVPSNFPLPLSLLFFFQGPSTIRFWDMVFCYPYGPGTWSKYFVATDYFTHMSIVCLNGEGSPKPKYIFYDYCGTVFSYIIGSFGFLTALLSPHMVHLHLDITFNFFASISAAKITQLLAVIYEP